MALRLRRLLLPGRVRWRRGISSENYGRRAELYDEDVFVPIDEAPAGVARRRSTASWSDVRTILEVLQHLKESIPRIEARRRRRENRETKKHPPNRSSPWCLHKVLEYLKSLGFSKPTAIQSMAWPSALKGADLVGLAETGSGKTLAYLLPAMMHVQRVKSTRSNGTGPIALVLAPTRELVMQIQWEAFRLGELLQIRDAVAYGGVPRRGQQQELRRGVELLIATPGRLMDFVNTKVTSLERVSYFVVDEADRMLDMGFEPQMRQVVSSLPTQRQTLMWSATWPSSIQDLVKDFCKEDPMKISIGMDEARANPNVVQDIRMVTELEKKHAFFNWLQEVSPVGKPAPRILIFIDTKKGAHALCRELRYEQFAAGEIHGDKDQTERDAMLHNFRKGKCQILVATDVAQRGLDIKDVDYVVNYTMPNTIEDYIHRIGRTGRAGATGIAVSFFSCDFRASDKVRFARRLVKVIEEAKQEVPEALQRFSERNFHQDKGWGFVTSEEITSLFFGKDIFLHSKQLNDTSVIPSQGDEAHFSIEVSEQGKLQAHAVDVFPAQEAGQYEATSGPVRSLVRPSMRSAPY
eukprot:symbB.v1.2.040112.t2/scaffold6998.1/size13989/2